MTAALKAGILYFAIVFAGAFAMGVLRTTVVAPRLGAVTAVAVEIPLILVLSWLASRRLVASCNVEPRHLSRFVMGAAAFLLLMLAEAWLSLALLGRTLPEHFAAYRSAAALMGFAAQIVFAAMPIIQLRLASDADRRPRNGGS